MGATSEFRRDLQSVRLYYLSTLEAYRSSILEHKNSDKDLVKVTNTPNKNTNLEYIDHNYYVFKDDHIRKLEENQSTLRLTVAVSLTSALEKYLKGVLMVIFRSAPRLFSNIKSNQEMDFGAVIRFENYSNLTSHYINKELRRIGERSLQENSDYFKKHFDIDFQSLGVRWERILQASKYRNAIIHSDAKTKDVDGKLSSIYIDHWNLLQTMDDMYSLSVYIGKRVREIITDHSKAVKRRVVPKSIVLLSIDSDYFDLAQEFKGQYRFTVSGSSVMQLSDLEEFKTSRSDETVYVLIKDSTEVISDYIKSINDKLRKIRHLSYRYDFVYREDESNPVVTYEMIESMKNAFDLGLENEQIIEAYSRGDAPTIAVARESLKIACSMPSEDTIREITSYIDQNYSWPWPQGTRSDVERHFLLDRQVVHSAMGVIKAKILRDRLQAVHLSIR